VKFQLVSELQQRASYCIKMREIQDSLRRENADI
jgi:hypothetical protein